MFALCMYGTLKCKFYCHCKPVRTARRLQHADKALTKEKRLGSGSCGHSQRKHSVRFAFHSSPETAFSRRQEHGRKSVHTATLPCWPFPAVWVWKPASGAGAVPHAHVKLICHQLPELGGNSKATISKEHLIIAGRP